MLCSYKTSPNLPGFRRKHGCLATLEEMWAIPFDAATGAADITALLRDTDVPSNLHAVLANRFVIAAGKAGKGVKPNAHKTAATLPDAFG